MQSGRAGTTKLIDVALLARNFANKQDSFEYIDNPPKGPSAGDQYFITSHVVHGASGHTSANCSIDRANKGGVRQCAIDFALKRGAITTRGITDLAGTKVNLVITGGTGRFLGAGGYGKLTPTATGSTVTLTVVRPG